MHLISTTVFLPWQAGNKLEIRELESWSFKLESCEFVSCDRELEPWRAGEKLEVKLPPY